MISKCQNIVINRTKFSDFPDYDVASQPTEGLKIVGYVDTYDICSGEHIKQNVALNYADVSEVNIKTPDNYFVDDFQNFEPINGYVIKTDLVTGYKPSFRITDKFEGSLIQFNLKDGHDVRANDLVYSTVRGNNNPEIVFSFAKTIPFGKEIKILIKNFPVTSIYDENTGEEITYRIKMIDYATEGSTPTPPITIFESSKKYLNYIENPSSKKIVKNILMTFVHSAASGVNSVESGKVDSLNRRMTVTNVEIID